MDTSILTDLGLTEMISALRAGDISSRQLTLFCLKRIEQLEPHLHAFLTLIPEKALARAEAADRQIGAWRKNPDQPLPPLAGIPIAVKDVLCVADVRCTCGSRILENFVPPFNATAVDRLLEAGVIIVGKPTFSSGTPTTQAEITAGCSCSTASISETATR